MGKAHSKGRHSSRDAKKEGKSRPKQPEALSTKASDYDEDQASDDEEDQASHYNKDQASDDDEDQASHYDKDNVSANHEDQASDDEDDQSSDDDEDQASDNDDDEYQVSDNDKEQASDDDEYQEYDVDEDQSSDDDDDDDDDDEDQASDDDEDQASDDDEDQASDDDEDQASDDDIDQASDEDQASEENWWESGDCGPDALQDLVEQVPQIYCLGAEPQAQEEEQAVSRLLQPLEWLLFGEDPHAALEKLQQSSGSSQRCGHVFKEGETVYSCRDCAIAPQYVLCLDCFQNSVHKGHHYTTFPSHGSGGFCDCGDLEAWKTDPCCTKHDPGDKLFGVDPRAALEKLQQSSRASQLCGRVFKEGETMYTCRDCAIDTEDNVLCMDCFQNSVHKGHRYEETYAGSGSGGFCNCGDLEAWKTGPCCTRHDPGHAVAMEKDGECALEAGLQKRARKLFQVLLRYTTDLLVWEENFKLPPELQPSMKEDTYYCVVYNDEYHSNDHVIYTLQRSVQCDRKEAQTHTIVIDKEGRCAVKRGSRLACQKAKSRIHSISERISLRPLRVEVLHSAVMAHQSFAMRLGAWFQQVIGYSVGFRQVFCQVALEPGPASDQPSLISRLMLHDARLYKGVRKIVHKLIVCSLIMETEYKRLFAFEFTKHYKQLQNDFINDDQELSITVTDLSGHIYSMPTLARQLIEERNIIKVIVDTVMGMLSEHLDSNNRFQFQGYNSEMFFRIQVIFRDLRYILNGKPTVWTNKLRTQFREGFRTFLGMLACMQGMDEVKCQFGQQIEIEPEWEAGFNIQIKLRYILSMFQDWCASDEEVLLLAFRDCLTALKRCNNQPFSSDPVESHMRKHILHHRPYKVSQELVSIHLPISRLLAGLYVHLCRTGAVKRLHEYVDPQSYDFAYLAEHPLRCIVLAAQVSAEMWHRNGLSLVCQVNYYQDVICRDVMFDKDIIMLQIAASKMDPNLFLMLILQRFELFDVFNGNTSSKDQEILKRWNRLIEEMLHLLIIIIGERYVPGISQVNSEVMTMREVIHLLCIEPMSHSNLDNGLPENENYETGLENVIHKVSTSKKPEVSDHGLYKVKKEYLQEFNPFFYHYSKSQRSKAEYAQKKKRTHGGRDKALPPPLPPAFSPAFSNIVRLLDCDIFIHILRQVLQRVVEDRVMQWTEAMVQRALHLIGQALLEEKTQLKAGNKEELVFDFSLKAKRIGSEHGKSLFHILSKLMSFTALEGQKDMINWTLQVFDNVKCLREKPSPHTSMSLDRANPDEQRRIMRKCAPGHGRVKAPPPPSRAARMPNQRMRKCKVAFDYSRQNKDELDLVVGETVEIIKECEAGWWLGMKNGEVGAFPSNFVKEIYITPKDAKKEGKSRPKQPEAQFSKVKEPRRASVRKITDANEYAQVMFDYAGMVEDELTMKEGDFVQIISKEKKDEGWWEGVLNGKRGFFPKDFVRLIPTDALPVKEPQRANERKKETMFSSTVYNESYCETDGSHTSTVTTVHYKRTQMQNTEQEQEKRDLPTYWSPKAAGQQCLKTRLKAGTTEHKEVLDLFQATCKKKVLKIERVQNPKMWKIYQIMKHTMDQSNGHQNNERKLFHGTSQATIHHINHNGFNRGYAGKNAAVYGNGTYFAVGASYSASGTYSVPDALGHKYMYLCRVLTGDFTAGTKGMIEPPPKSDSSHQLYDSATDKLNNPTMFIIFRDHQAYPEYLITFC